MTSSNPTTVPAGDWEESTGLLASLIPQDGSISKLTSPNAFNLSKGDLKLGPAPISDELRAETERSLREQSMLDRDPASQYDTQMTRPQPLPGIIAPSESDLLPHPPTFKTIDVEREVSAVRDARKRIRFDTSGLGSLDSNTARAKALPSICAYTLHDVPEGCVSFVPPVPFTLH